MKKPNKNERFLQKFYRQVVKADFKANDSVLPSAFPTWRLVDPKAYAKGKSLARFGEFTWSLVVFVIFFITTAAIGLGWSVIYDKITSRADWQQWLLIAGVAALFLFSLYVTLAMTGYIRWMLRTRR